MRRQSPLVLTMRLQQNAQLQDKVETLEARLLVERDAVAVSTLAV